MQSELHCKRKKRWNNVTLIPLPKKVRLRKGPYVQTRPHLVLYKYELFHRPYLWPRELCLEHAVVHNDLNEKGRTLEGILRHSVFSWGLVIFVETWYYQTRRLFFPATEDLRRPVKLNSYDVSPFLIKEWKSKRRIEATPVWVEFKAIIRLLSCE